MASMRTSKFQFLMMTIFVSLPLCFAGAQQLTWRQKIELANCALHGGGGWVDSNLYAHGKVQFTYVSEPSDVDPNENDPDFKDPHDIYVAFWNWSRSGGDLLVFTFSKNSKGKDVFVMDNNTQILSKNGRLDVDDPLGGIWTRRKLQGLLPILRRKAVTIVTANRARAGYSLCWTFTDPVPPYLKAK